MNRHPQTIHEILTQWGQGKRHLPVNNEALKNQVLAKLSPSQETLHAPRSFPWLSLAFAGLAIVVFFVTPISSSPTLLQETPSISTPFALPDSLSPTAQYKSARETSGNVFPQRDGLEYYPSTPEIPISDTREFLKTDYHARIRTRSVEELTSRTQTIVRGFGGRIDASSSSSKGGFVSFVVPASRFDAFRLELKGLINPRFFIEETSAQNFLPQKQSIEHEREQTHKTLTQLRTDREDLVIAHRQVVAPIQARLAAISQGLSDLQTERIAHPEREKEITIKEQELSNEKKVLEKRLHVENVSYANQLTSFDAQIRYSETELERLDTKDRQLLESVATVRGTISLNWISVWEIINAYLPSYWISLLLAGGAIVTYLIHRRRSRLIAL